MKDRPVLPELKTVVPEVPLPWELSRRREILSGLPDGFFWRALDEIGNDGQAKFQLREYNKWALEHYLVPGNVSAVINSAFWLVDDLGSVLTTGQTENDYFGMIRRFEQEYLGLQPSTATDGLHYWESSSGFASGKYPTGIVASVFGLTPEVFVNYIEENSEPVGHIIAKADNYMFSVANNIRPKDTVIVGSIKELTREGNEFLNAVIQSYEMGLKSH